MYVLCWCGCLGLRVKLIKQSEPGELVTRAVVMVVRWVSVRRLFGGVQRGCKKYQGKVHERGEGGSRGLKVA